MLCAKLKMFLTLLLICVFLPLGVSAQSRTGISDGYKITLPDGFQMDKALSYTGSTTFSDKKSNITVTSQKLTSKENVTIKSLADDITKDLKRSRFKIIKSSMGQAGEYPMFCIKHSPPNNSKAVTLSYGILADKTVYMISCTTTTSLVDKYEPKFNKMIKSFSK